MKTDKRLLLLYKIAFDNGIKIKYGNIPYKKAFTCEYDCNIYICLDEFLTEKEMIAHLTHEIKHALDGVSNETMPEWINKSRENGR